MAKKQKAELPNRGIYLLFNDSDWGEIVASIESKIAYLKKGFYDPNGTNKAEDKRWVAQLQSIKKTLEKKLRENNIPY